MSGNGRPGVLERWPSGTARQWLAVDGAAPEVRGVGTDFGDLVEWEEEYASRLEFTSPDRQLPNKSTKLNARPTASQHPEGYTVPQQFPKLDRGSKSHTQRHST